MKPTSVIFLIFSVILIASGIGVLFLAKDMAEEQHVALFSQFVDDDGNLIEKYDFSDDNISRLTLTLGDVDVHIYGNAESSYIELINFPKNTYDLSVSSKTISIDNTISMMSFYRIRESGLNFSGLRHYLNLRNYSDRDRTLNIYISKEENIKIYDITQSKGSISISDLNYRADYSISLKKGDLYASNLTTNSVFNVNIGKGSVTLDSCFIENCGVILGAGDLEYSFNGLENQAFEVRTGSGKVYFNGEDMGLSFAREATISYIKLTAEVTEGNIRINADKVQ